MSVDRKSYIGIRDSESMSPFDIKNDSGSARRVEEELIKRLIDPRTISKEIDPIGRSRLARRILEKLAERRDVQTILSEKESEAQKVKSKISDSADQKDERRDSLLRKFKDFKQKIVSVIRNGRTEITQESLDLLQEIEREIESLRAKAQEIPSPRELLETYYKEIASHPLTNEQKRELLKPEILASLTTEEYIALWRRLNPFFMSHVTRQGFRDHNASEYHRSGLQEFHNGFVEIMKDQRLLRPPLAIAGLRNRDEASIRQWLSDWVLQAPDQKEAEERLNRLLNFRLASAPKYPDKTSVHFAAQIVADRYYGGERNNEIFFVYPTDVLASQYNFAFNGEEKDLTRPQSETIWNDIFVWPRSMDNPGIPVDSGIVFLPARTLVDPITGSKYASEVKVIDGEEKRVMIEDRELVKKFIQWGLNLEKSTELMDLVSKWGEERVESLRQLFVEDCVRTFSQEIEKLGFDMESSLALARKLIFEIYLRKNLSPEILNRIIIECGAHWKRADNPITAKEYWENFFKKNPHLRPRHVVYYEGNPTTAVYKFFQENGIGHSDNSNIDGPLLGFDDHHILDLKTDPRANEGYDDLLTIAREIIRKHYSSEN